MQICLISPLTITPEVEAVRPTSESAPLGILTLAAVLEQRGLAPVIVDLNRLYREYLRAEARHTPGLGFAAFTADYLASSSFDVYGFGTICSTYPLTLRIGRQLKAASPGVAVMLGGPQASVVDIATMQAFPCIDFVVRGEAD